MATFSLSTSFIEIHFLENLLFYVYQCCLHACLCTMCVPGAARGQKKVSEPLQLELEVAMSG